MKRLSFLFVLFFIYDVTYAQQDTGAVLKAVVNLRKALVEKDSNTLRQLLHKSIAFGHSNGWVQSKADVFSDMKSGFLVYQHFDVLSTEITINKQYATVKEKIGVEGSRAGTTFKLNLFVLHLWVKEKSGWQLLTRQSTKL